MSEVTTTENATENLELTTMELSDTVADWMAAFNGNMEIIDEAVHGLQNVGSANAGKFMVVANDGTVTPTTVPSANGVSF